MPVVTARCQTARRRFEENLLITHRGLSGPAVLQISSYRHEGEAVDFNLLPEVDAAAMLAQARLESIDAATLLSRFWPRRFAEAWSARYAPAKKLPHFTAAETGGLGFDRV